MRTVFIGNCQSEGLALCANHMAPAHAFAFVDIGHLPDAADLTTLIGDYDVVFAQNMLRSRFSPAALAKTRFFPTIAFPAFHPDQCYLRGTRLDTGELTTVVNDMVMYHSAIIVAGFKAGMSPDRVVELFTVANFARLGYLDVWADARRDLLVEGRACGVSLGAMFDGWARSGCFMHSINHPSLPVYEDLARTLLLKAGIAIEYHNVARYLDDPFRNMSIWPVYPGIADRLGMRGDYGFVRGMLKGTMNLREFVEHSFAIYQHYDRSSLDTLGARCVDATEALGLSAPAKPHATNEIAGNPYRDLPPERFWKSAVVSVKASTVDPVLAPRFTISPTDRVATAGSCFAQHIARNLREHGFNYFVAEASPPTIDREEAASRNFGVFSARYGNIYTVRQLVQLLDRASGAFVPEEMVWHNLDGNVVDPYRPRIEPLGFPDMAAMMRARAEHLEAVERMIRDMDVFVLTLGLTEGWRSKDDGSVLPLAPGVAGGRMDIDRYEFVNFTVDEVIADLHAALDRIWEANPHCRVILTVSPVPLVATYEPRHALAASAYTKAVLRVAADTIYRQYQQVDYFPCYEIATGAFSRGGYFEDNLRNVSADGVAHVMRVFMKHYAPTDIPLAADTASGVEPSRGITPDTALRPRGSRTALADIVCDEEAIANL